MSGKLRWLYVVLAVAVAAWFFSQRGGDERRILRQLESLRETLEKPTGEGDLAGVQKARELGEFFTQSFEIRGEPLGVLTDRQRMMQVALQYRRSVDSVGVGFSDRQLALTGEGPGRLGEMELVVTLTGRTGVDLRRESYRVFFLWGLESDEWKIRQIELLEVLEGGPFF